MKSKYKNPIVLATLLLAALTITDLVAATTLENGLEVSNNKPLLTTSNIDDMKAATLTTITVSKRITASPSVTTVKSSPITVEIANNEVVLPIEVPAEVERLKKLIPRTIAEAEVEVLPLRNRFLMWTCDLEHIMWGNYRNNIFVGKDNQGEHVWGLFGNGYFAGIYNGEFFWGKYSNGHWKAKGLFGEDETWGKYVVSPTILAVRYIEKLEDSTPNLVQTISTDKPMEDSTALSANQVSPSIEMPEEVEKLREAIPNSYKATEAAVGPLRNKFLMWTYNLKNIMWGHYGNIYFVGQDNQGKRAWGIYGDGIFAGIYDGDFFWGFYRSGRWRAFRLFGKTQTYGRYLTARPT
jgi:hypothetical protein